MSSLSVNIGLSLCKSITQRSNLGLVQNQLLLWYDERIFVKCLFKHAECIYYWPVLSQIRQELNLQEDVLLY